MSNPLSPHPRSDSLASSTAITVVSDATMDHAAEQAAQLVRSAVAVKRSKSGRKAPATALDADKNMQETLDQAELLTAAETSDGVAEAVQGTTDFAVEGLEVLSVPPSPIAGESSRQGNGELTDTPRTTEIRGENAEAGYSWPATDTLAQLRGKLVEAFQNTAGASLTYWMSLMDVKSPAEVVELNDRHLRQQMAAFLSQSRELSALAQKAALMSLNVGSGTR